MKIMTTAAAVSAALLFPFTVSAQQPAPPLDAYGNLPQTEDVALSPSGRIAMITTVNDKRILLMLDENLQVLNTTAVGDIKVRNINWVGDDNVVLIRTDTQELGDRYWADSA